MFEQLHAQLTTSLVACRVRPDHKAVHTLRTTVRRIEALLLALQNLHPRAAPLQQSLQQALQPLKRVRRAAGPVRDLDVQRGLVETITQRHQHATTNDQSQKLQADCAELDRHLRRRRKAFAKELASTANKLEPTLEEAFESAASHLKQLDSISLLAIARKIAVHSAMDLKTHGPNDLNEIKRGSLHSFRKQIKAARYASGDGRRVRAREAAGSAAEKDAGFDRPLA